MSSADIAQHPDLSDQMHVGRTTDLAPLRSCASVTLAPDTAIPRAVTLRCVRWPELAATMQTWAWVALEAILPAAMRVESRSTVGTDDLQILETVVVGDAIEMVEDQRHPPASPHFVLAAQLTLARLQTLLEQPSLEMHARVSRSFDQDEAQGDGSFLERVVASAIGVEMIGGNLPDLLDVPAQGSVIAARRAHAQSSEHIRVATRCSHGAACFLLRVSGSPTWHEHMFALGGDTELTGEPGLEPGLEEPKSSGLPITPLPNGTTWSQVIPLVSGPTRC